MIAPDFRGTRSAGGRSLVLDLLSTLYAFAVDQGMPVLFGLAPPPVAAIHKRAGCRTISVDAPAYVLVSNWRSFARATPSRGRSAAGFGLWIVQSLLVLAFEALVRVATGNWHRATVDLPRENDVALVRADIAGRRWTISGSDAWDWLAGSGVLRTVDVRGRFGSRAIVRMDDSQQSSIQIVAWRARCRGLRPPLLLLASVARLARRRGAPTLRFQPWNGSGGDGSLAHACRLLGFVRRREADLVIYGEPTAFDADQVQLTPFFYVTF